MQKRILVLLFSGLVASLCAFGDTATDTYWQIDGTGGSYTYGGGTDALVGSGIQVGSVVDAVGGDTAGFSTYDLLGAAGGVADLSFTSGAGTSGNWSWTGGGTLSVVGCIEDPSNLGHCILGETTSTVLISDDFTDVTISQAGGSKGFVFGGLQGTINAGAAALLGVATSFSSPESQMSTKVTGLPVTLGNSFTSGVKTASSGGNLDLYSAVPESWGLSSTLGFFVFSLAVFGFGRRLGLIRALAF
jgi:hypothetical protein